MFPLREWLIFGDLGQLSGVDRFMSCLDFRVNCRSVLQRLCWTASQQRATADGSSIVIGQIAVETSISASADRADSVGT
jgi:hypothetical protein